MLPFQCPLCSGMFQVSESSMGQAVACPHCRGGVLIPDGVPPKWVSTPSPPESQPAGTPLVPLPSPPPPLPPPIAAPPILSPSVSAPPIYPPTKPAPPMFAPASAPHPSSYLPPQLPSSVTGKSDEPPTAVDSAPTPQHFVIPTVDGGQAVIREPTRVAVSGTQRRSLRSMTAEERATHRWIKNCVVFSVCAVLLMALFWWLLATGPL